MSRTQKVRRDPKAWKEQFKPGQRLYCMSVPPGGKCEDVDGGYDDRSYTGCGAPLFDKDYFNFEEWIVEDYPPMVIADSMYRHNNDKVTLYQPRPVPKGWKPHEPYTNLMDRLNKQRDILEAKIKSGKGDAFDRYNLAIQDAYAECGEVAYNKHVISRNYYLPEVEFNSSGDTRWFTSLREAISWFESECEVRLQAYIELQQKDLADKREWLELKRLEFEDKLDANRENE